VHPQLLLASCDESTFTTGETLLNSKAVNSWDWIPRTIAEVYIRRPGELQPRVFGDDRLPRLDVDILVLIGQVASQIRDRMAMNPTDQNLVAWVVN
jgi:hypothetical protein